MRVLVTGGAGFIGSHLSRRLVADGHAVTIVDNLSTGDRDVVPAGTDFVELDVATPGTLDDLGPRPFDAVCHLAGQSSGEKSYADPVTDFDANARATLLVADWAARRGVECVVHASSMAVYGARTELPVAEDQEPRPISFYGASKRAAEDVLRLHEGRLRTVSLRMFSVYGPGQDLEELRQGMVSIYLSYILRGLPVAVRGSLERVRDFVFVDDVVAAWVCALTTPAAGVFNVGTGVGTTVRSLLGQLLAACGRGDDYPVEVLPGTPGDQFAMCADVTRATAELGWSAGVALDDGLAELVRWAQTARTST
jgi:UDP-glucose 4-epimerase